MRRRAVSKELFAAAKHDWHREDADRVDEIVGEQGMHEVSTALGNQVRAFLLPQTFYVGDIAQQHRALPARVDIARARNGILLNRVEQLCDAAIRAAFIVIGPVRGENLVGLAAEQEIELLLKEAIDLFAEHLIEIRHPPSAELKALGRILGWPARRLHDAVHGNHGADGYLSHVSSPVARAV